MSSKNTTAPPDPQDGLESMRGFIYLTPCIEFPDMGFIQSWPPVLQLGLATELLEMLAPVYPSGQPTVQRCAAMAPDLKAIERSASRHKDLILSCRDAAEPGQAYVERMFMHRDCAAGQSITAPQNAGSPARGAEGVA